MISAGMELYNRRGEEFIVNNVENNIINGTIIRITSVTHNNGKHKRTETIRQGKVYEMSDLGIELFFDKKYKDNYSKDILKDKKYLFNKDNIYAYIRSVEEENWKRTKAGAPEILMTQADKRRIITNYKSKISSQNEEKEFYNKYYKLQEYFARIDLDTEYYRPQDKESHKKHYYEKYYIGRGVDAKYEKYGILDWRTPVASLYYDSNTNKIERKDIGVYKSELMLRRQLNFNPLSFKNTYILGDEFYSGGSIDPFLMEVMETNRKNHQMGNIIKSIQSNQNEIIREKPRLNIVVQGCAGSGKTMILLHRLSYLKYNKYLSDLSRTKIITPNYLFTSFTKSISNDLELKEIEHLTIYDYYRFLARKYISEYDINPKGSREREIIKKINIDKKTLTKSPKDHEIYFTSFFVEYLKDSYNSKLLEWKSMINYSELLAIVNKINESINIDDLESNHEAFTYLYNLGSNELKRMNEETEKQASKFDDRIERSNNYLNIMDKYESRMIDLKSIIMDRKLRFKKFQLQNKDNESIQDFIHQEYYKMLVEVPEAIRDSDFKGMEYNLMRSIGFRKYREILDECFTDISEQLIKFRDNYLYGDLKIENILHHQYEMILENSYNICNYKIKQINGFKKGHIETIELAKQEKTGIERNLLTKEEKELVKRSNKLLKDRDGYLFSLYFEILEDIMDSDLISSKIGNKDNYKIFILLNLFYLYYGPTKSKEGFLFFDEGQDYSPAEYKLINNINDGDTVFNIYGDINQALAEERLIEDWNKLIRLLDGKYFELNENYRNTKEITEFCNKKFNYKHRAIGISGPNISYINAPDIEFIIDKLLIQDKKTRIAIITKEEDNFINDILERYKDYNDKSIVIGDIKKVKGLEFDTVFVCTDKMNKNELYISYSRSLRQLYIIDSDTSVIAVEEKKEGKEEVLFYFERRSGEGGKGIGTPTPEGFIVFKGAYLTPKLSPSASKKVRNLRREYKGIIRKNTTTEDIVFCSPSTASGFLCGTSSNGRTEWKTKEGIELKEIQGYWLGIYL